jgi:hypothetical protein
MTRLPFPAASIIGLPIGRLKDASGAATAAGLRPVLDPPARSPRTWQLPENRRGQSRMPADPAVTGITPAHAALDRGSLLQG